MIEFEVPSLVPRSLLSFCHLHYGKSDIFVHTWESLAMELLEPIISAHYFTTYRFSLIS